MNDSPFFQNIYKSEWQGTWALWVLPLAFLAYLLFSTTERDRRASTQPMTAFLGGWMLFWTVETLADSFATGPLSRWLGWQGTEIGTGVMLSFVLLGDLRVFQLVFRIGRPADSFGRALRRAILWTLLVPVVAYGADTGLRQWRPGLPEQMLWLIYETSFFAVALYLRNVWLRSHASGSSDQQRLRVILAFVAGYYLLWATADILIMGFDLDFGWAVRVIPNQLYYAFFVPFVWWTLARDR